MHTVKSPFRFGWRWVDPSNSKPATDLIRTLAYWNWEVRGQILTRHQLEPDTQTQDELLVSLLPFVEFLLANWWVLLHEQSEKTSNLDRIALLRRHIIDVHSDGFAYPAVSIFGAGSNIRVTAQTKHIRSAGIDFTTATEGRQQWLGLPREDFEQHLIQLARDTVQQLGNCPMAYELRDWLQAIEESRKNIEEARFCMAAGLLGEDPYTMESTIQQALLDTVEQFGEEFAYDLFAANDASTLVTERESVRAVDMTLPQGNPELAAAITEARRVALAAKNNAAQPWQQGYAVAASIRKRIGNEQGFTDFSSLSKAVLGLNWIPDERATLPLAVQGFGRCDEKGASVVLALPPRRNRLFGWAQMLGNMLLSSSQPYFISIKNASDRQKSARAFAAELLLPASVLLSSDWKRGRQKLLRHYGVSNAIAKYQYQNQIMNLDSMV